MNSNFGNFSTVVRKIYKAESLLIFVKINPICYKEVKNGKSYQVKLEKPDEESKFHGMKIGDNFKGEIIDLSGYEFVITGGSDRSGFPMRKGVHGSKRIKIFVKGGVGFKPKRKGERRRKSICGEVVSDLTSQINVKVTKEGKKKLDEVFKKEEKGEGESKEKK